MNNQKGQTLLELVVGMSLVTVIIGALAITTTYSLRNSQFSKNQTQATKYAQEYMEQVRTIKSANYGICYTGQPLTACSSWDEIWVIGGQFQTRCGSGSCKFNIVGGCTSQSGSAPVCLREIASPTSIGGVFTAEILLQNEAGFESTQKRVTAKVYWNDASGQHSSDLVTVFSKL